MVIRQQCRGIFESLSARRAWIEIVIAAMTSQISVSLSARRAWIEIPAGCWRDARRAVALRKESVDRNYIIKITEIWGAAVALRKESVDRNARIMNVLNGLKRRSPQGERG